MIGFGMLTSALSLLGLWLLRGGRLPSSPWFYRAALWTIPFPLIANAFGWLFTEMGRQPWVVYGQMFTRDGVSPLVGPGMVATSLIVLMLLYLVLAVIEIALIVRYAKAGPPGDEPDEPDEPADGTSERAAERPLTFAY